jgi:DNA polymerase III subunit delta'
MMLFGHDHNMRIFTSAVASGKTHHAWILAGKRGLGKATFAASAARQLIDAEGRYTNLIDRGNHPDLITIKRLLKEPPKEGEDPDPAGELKRSIGVDQIRSLQTRLTTRPGLSDKRAIIIDCADDFERSAANALLKSLEEPPAGTFFFLISHSSDRLLPTIRSRCQILRFEPLDDTQMHAALSQVAPDLDLAARQALVASGSGAPGQAIEFLGLEIEQLESDIDLIMTSGDPTNALRLKLAGQLSLKNAQLRYEAFVRRVPQKLADAARSTNTDRLGPAIEAWEASTHLASRAIGVTLDKQSVVMQMGTLLASLNTKR